MERIYPAKIYPPESYGRIMYNQSELVFRKKFVSVEHASSYLDINVLGFNAGTCKIDGIEKIVIHEVAQIEDRIEIKRALKNKFGDSAQIKFNGNEII